MAQDDYVRTALRLPPELHQELHAAADAKGRSFNAELIERLQQAGELARQLKDAHDKEAGLLAITNEKTALLHEMKGQLESVTSDFIRLKSLTGEQAALLMAAEARNADLAAALDRARVSLDHERARHETLIAELRRTGAELAQRNTALTQEVRRLSKENFALMDSSFSADEVEKLRKELRLQQELAAQTKVSSDMAAALARVLARTILRALDLVPPADQAHHPELELHRAVAEGVVTGAGEKLSQALAEMSGGAFHGLVKGHKWRSDGGIGLAGDSRRIVEQLRENGLSSREEGGEVVVAPADADRAVGLFNLPSRPMDPPRGTVRKRRG